jgi:hypothetical protein
MARTAVIAGTANATVNVMNSKAAAKQQAAHQQAAAAQAAADEAAATQARLAALEQQAAAPQPAAVETPAAPAGDDIIARLQQLAELRTAGVLNDDEFEQAKARILGG